MPLKFFVNPNGTVDILAKQGEDWTIIIKLTDDEGNPIDLAGYSVKGAIRETYGSSEAYLFTCSIEDANNGIIKAYLSPSQTSSIPAYRTSVDGMMMESLSEEETGVYVYDIKIYNSERAVRILEGKLVVDPEVSK